MTLIQIESAELSINPRRITNITAGVSLLRGRDDCWTPMIPRSWRLDLWGSRPRSLLDKYRGLAGYVDKKTQRGPPILSGLALASTDHDLTAVQVPPPGDPRA